MVFLRGVVAAMALAALMSCGGEVKPPEGGVVPVRRAELAISLEELGVVESTRVAKIVAPFEGRVMMITGDGTAVRKGDVVAVLETSSIEESLENEVDKLNDAKKDLEAAIEKMRRDLRSNALDLAAAQAQLDLARVELEQVNQNLSELEYLKTRNIVADDQVRRALFEMGQSETSTRRRDMNLRGESIGSQNTRATNSLALERIDLRGQLTLGNVMRLNSRVQDAQIYAPVDGLFLRTKRWQWSLRRMVERQIGEQVNEGEELGTIPDLSAIIIRTQIPEDRVRQVTPGTPVEVRLDSLGNLRMDGIIERIAPIAIERETSAGGRITASGDRLSGEKVFEAVVTLSRADERLKPGLTARCRVMLENLGTPLTVPLGSVLTRDGRHYVGVWEQGKMQIRSIEPGATDGNVVEIRGGLAEGEQVLAEPRFEPPAAPIG